MAQLILANPRKRRKTRSKSRGLTTRKRTRSRFRRNPLRLGGIGAQVKKGLIGGMGALAVDVAMTKLPIPENLRTGPLAAVTKGAVGIAIGMLVSKFGKKSLGTELADGAITVAAYNTAKSLIGPSLGLSGYEDGLLGYDDGLLGYQSPAPIYDNAFSYESDDTDF